MKMMMKVTSEELKTTKESTKSQNSKNMQETIEICILMFCILDLINFYSIYTGKLFPFF
jgi:hypothetical protein